MAFRQPTRAPLQRQRSVPVPTQTTSIEASQRSQRQLEDSQEWVLFSPTQAPSTTQTQTTSTGKTCTAGLSRLSDFGSLDTAARSQDVEEEDENLSDDTEGALEEDEGEELDSLDSHLHAFAEPSVYRNLSRRLGDSGGSVLPTHDGLGTFQGSSPPVQEQLWQFEQFNPRRRAGNHKRRRSSVLRRLEEAEEGDDTVRSERIQRIEEWRMEHSRVLLDEIERETRKRRMSRANSVANEVEAEKAAMGVSERDAAEELLDQRTQQSPTADIEERESFWKRITRRVIRDLMGIDESLLSVIFGESLPVDPSPGTLNPPLTSLASNQPPLDDRTIDIQNPSGWEDRLLERIARELGILVNQLTEHPGAFSTYLRTTNITPEYAGIPVTSRPSIIPPTQTSTAASALNLTSTYSPHFAPTIQHQEASTHAALWGIEEEEDDGRSDRLEADRLRGDREYWERELDVKMVFGFLRNRFSPGRDVPNQTHRTTSELATSSTQQNAARAAMIRQHHPLVSRTHDLHRQARRSGSVLHHHHRPHPQSPVVANFRRPSSSCASQSTNKKSKTRESGSSRNYWDIGESVGSGSAIATTGGMGAWGEV
ncbi:MAG: hypothetical protein M1827_004580 [Pycnora praestabilis]|nr:MAG: hypothetical protein M1827_004580 [Pycnora praestabilis]